MDNPEDISRRERKLIRRYGSIMANLIEIGLDPDDAMKIKAIVAPYVRSVSRYLDISTDVDEAPAATAINSGAATNRAKQSAIKRSSGNERK